MRTRIFAVAVAALAAASAATGITPAASAHEGNPNFRSTVTSIEPTTEGVDAEILNLDDRLLLTAQDGHSVEVAGYKGEPYARILPDGTVQMNTRSPAYYLNEDRFARAGVPEAADEDAEPQWETVGANGRLEFHDHRIHWMAEGTPPQVKDEGEKTKVFDWTVPISVDGTPADVTGELTWVPDEGGFPIAAGVGLAAFLLGSIAFVVIVRRRRDDDAGSGPGAEVKEAW